MLFESELAELDRLHKVGACRCDVLERGTGRRVGGYLIVGERMIVTVRDEDFDRKIGKRGRQSGLCWLPRRCWGQEDLQDGST